jgi:7-carboxy-7-deazaguanine synthase
MSKLKVSELFYSLQGEGLYLGTPSIFLRLFGCNFTCSGFGMPRGEKSQERFQVDPKKMMVKPLAPANALTFAPVGASTELTLQYQKYEDLPLVHTGCDSYASWDPRFKHLSPVLTVEAIVERMKQLLPGGKFGTNKHLIITGGEPLLPGWQKQIPALLDEIYRQDMDLGFLTFETNGTQALTSDLSVSLCNRADYLETTFSISSKLPVSGEIWEEAIRPDVVSSYNLSAWTGLTNHNMYFKWVIENESDVEDVKRAIAEYNMPYVPVYLMPVGGTTKLYNLTHHEVANIAMKNGWRYSPRLQVELWKNAWGT